VSRAVRFGLIFGFVVPPGGGLTCGDGPNAVDVAEAVREAITAAGRHIAAVEAGG
jgi:hypothetical protein